VKKLLDQFNDNFLRLLIIYELRKALVALPQNSCLGDDGLTPSFFYYALGYHKRAIMCCLSMILNIRYMPQRFTKGLIYLIPKGDVSFDNICKWRPIILQ
jgi:hypothetical protein